VGMGQRSTCLTYFERVAGRWCLTYFERMARNACPMWKARSIWLRDGR
jgi:hypothetical protein